MIRALAIAAALMLLALASLPAGAAELVMFDRKGCPWCAKWHAEIGVEGYARSPEARMAPLRVYLFGTPMPADIKRLKPIIGTPTFVLMDNGVEVDRFEGYPGKAVFYGRLQLALDRLTGADKQYKTIIVQ
jgi:hypothetical protein